MEGWICVRCQRAWAPWVAGCRCKPILVLHYDSSSIEELKEAFKSLEAQEVSLKISETIEKLYEESMEE